VAFVLSKEIRHRADARTLECVARNSCVKLRADGPRPKAVIGSAGSYPAMTSRMSAASVTVRAMGPTSSCVWLFGMSRCG
jgi:hypothetical protein